MTLILFISACLLICFVILWQIAKAQGMRDGIVIGRLAPMTLADHLRVTGGYCHHLNIAGKSVAVPKEHAQEIWNELGKAMQRDRKARRDQV